MKIKVSDATELQLDWLVLSIRGVPQFGAPAGRTESSEFALMHDDDPDLQFTTNWAQGGPIIERIGGFHMKVWLDSKPNIKCEAHIHNYEGDWIMFGPTPLIAAMRCYVASKLGDEVEIPEELV